MRDDRPLFLRPVDAPPAPWWDRRVLAARLAAAVGATIAAVLAGWLAGGALTGDPPVPAPVERRTVDLGPVRLATEAEPAGARPATILPELGPATSVALQPVPGLPAYAVVTFAPIDHPTLLPAAFRSVLVSAPPRPSRQQLLGRSAWHYAELPIAGDRLMELTVAPTSVGALAIACVAPRELGRAAATGCESAITELSLTEGSWQRPTAAVAMRANAAPAIERLDRRRSARRAALSRAPTSWAQSRIAGRLAADHRRAAAALAAYAVPENSAARVVSALRRAAGAYARLAAAARAGDRRGHGSARAAVARRDAELSRALAQLP